MSVTLVAGLALPERVGLGAEGARGTGTALAVVPKACARLGQECPCRDSGVTGSTATWSSAPAVPRCAVPCHTGRAALTCGTRAAAALGTLDPVHAGGTRASAGHTGGMSPQAEERLHRDPLPLPLHGGDPPPWGLRFAGRQPQRCQGHLRAGREQGCRQGESRAAGSGAAPGAVGTALTPAHAGPPEPEPYLELCGHRSLHRAERLQNAALGPKAVWVCCPRAGNAPRQPLCSAFPAVHEPATSCGHCGGHRALGAVKCPRVLCKWCCQAGWGAAPRCSTACANRTPAMSAGMGPSESGTRTGDARDCHIREVSVAGRVGVNPASFDFPGVYLPHRGGDFLPERKPCLAHALSDAIAAHYASPKVGHRSPAGCQVLSAGQPRSSPQRVQRAVPTLTPLPLPGPGPDRTVALTAWAGSQGIPRWGLDFPAVMAPITAVESFSTKPAATGRLETALGRPARRALPADPGAASAPAHLSHR